jgi:A/G-specific adenine glycosylase
VNPDDPGDHNQAMMELGASVCLRRRPACLLCPVRDCCAAGKAGDPEEYPRLEAKRTERRSVVRVWCERDGAVLLHRNPATQRRLADLHELPTAQQAGLDPDGASSGPLVARRHRTITRFRIVESIHAAPGPRGRLGPGLVWIRLGDLADVALSGPHRRWTTQILAARAPEERRPAGD